MAVTRKQIQDFHDLQDYIDAQFGGPGKGFFRIVTDPFQARRVMNDGKLAVFLGMELSRPLGCRLSTTSRPATSRRSSVELDDMYSRGVALVAAREQVRQRARRRGRRRRPDRRSSSTPATAARPATTGSWRPARRRRADKEQTTRSGDDEANFSQGLAQLAPGRRAHRGRTRSTRLRPHCNVRGLTDLGEHRPQLDHAPRDDHRHGPHVRARAQPDALVPGGAARYSGVISTHGWSHAGRLPSGSTRSAAS